MVRIPQSGKSSIIRFDIFFWQIGTAVLSILGSVLKFFKIVCLGGYINIILHAVNYCYWRDVTTLLRTSSSHAFSLDGRGKGLNLGFKTSQCLFKFSFGRDLQWPMFY